MASVSARGISPSRTSSRSRSATWGRSSPARSSFRRSSDSASQARARASPARSRSCSRPSACSRWPGSSRATPSASTRRARSTTTWARASASPSASSPGWVYYGGALMLTLAIGLAFGGFVSLTLLGVHDIHINWIWFTLAFWIVAWAISVLGVQISTRAQLLLALVSVAVIFGWSVYVILKGGSSGFSMRPFNPGESSFKGITYGIVYAGLIFVGFESAANLAEETAEPKRNIPRAIFYSVLAAGVFYVILVVGARAGVRPQRRRAAEELPAALRRDGQPRLRRQHVRRARAVARRDRHRGGRARHGDRHDARRLRARARPPSAEHARRRAPPLQDAARRGQRDRDRRHRRRADRALSATGSRPARRPIRRATGSRSSSSAPRSARSCSSSSTC